MNHDLNQQDPLPPLGKRIEPAAPPAPPALTPTDRPGVFRTPDGKLVTQIPENDRSNWIADTPCLRCGWGLLCFGDCNG
jgi:hypothetical protein